MLTSAQFCHTFTKKSEMLWNSVRIEFFVVLLVFVFVFVCIWNIPGLSLRSPTSMRQHRHRGWCSQGWPPSKMTFSVIYKKFQISFNIVSERGHCSLEHCQPSSPPSWSTLSEIMPRVQSPLHHPSCRLSSGSTNSVGMCVEFPPYLDLVFVFVFVFRHKEIGNKRVRCSSPAIVNIRTRCWEVWAILLVWTPWCSCLSAHLGGNHCSELQVHFANNYFLCFCLFVSRANLSWGPILTPAAANEGHPDVVRVDSRHRVACPCWALWELW